MAVQCRRHICNRWCIPILLFLTPVGRWCDAPCSQHEQSRSDAICRLYNSVPSDLLFGESWNCCVRLRCTAVPSEIRPTYKGDMKSSIPGSRPCQDLIWRDCRLFIEGGSGFLLSFKPALIRMYIMMCRPMMTETRKRYRTHMSCVCYSLFLGAKAHSKTLL